MSEQIYVTTPHSTRQEFTKGKLHNSFATKTEPCRQWLARVGVKAMGSWDGRESLLWDSSDGYII